MTLEMGKPIAAARAEAAKCAWACRYYAERGERLLADEPVEAGAGRSFIRYQPIGPVLAVMPWNFPFWQVFRFAAPALMAGNVGLLKHASNVPQCALEIEALIRRAGFPADVFQTLLIGSAQVARVIDDPRVKAVTLTGSEPAGAQVAAPGRAADQEDRAGAGRQRPVHRDAQRGPRSRGGGPPPKRAPSTTANPASPPSASSWTGAIAGEFERRFVAAMEALRVGDPMDESTQIGPLATPEILEGLDQQVRRSVQMGARLLTGGEPLARARQLLRAHRAGRRRRAIRPAYREELFGPVAALFRADGIDDAIRLANDTEFGLGASAWTNDPAEQRRLIDELEAGMVFINGMVASDPRLPFGGVKRSGYGRELSACGIREFVNVKTVRMG